MSGLPLVVFLDVNLPSARTADLNETRWMRDVNVAFDRMQTTGADARTSWSALIATNFGLQFRDDSTAAPPVEMGMLWSSHPLVALPKSMMKPIADQVLAYGKIPAET
jgi:hypothetical protein